MERLFYYLEQGLKVLLHCRHGHHRTGVAIYLLLRSTLANSAQCLSLMKEMRPEMHDQIVLHTRKRHLLAKAETIFASPKFRAGLRNLKRWYQRAVVRVVAAASATMFAME